MFWTGFIVGGFIGIILGMFTIALLSANRYDDCMDKIRELKDEIANEK